MNLKYYLRGLGLGIVITALLLGVTSRGRKAEPTEAEIITKAKELGMIEASELAQYVEEAKLDTEKKLRAELEKETFARIEEEFKAELEKEKEASSGQADQTGDGSLTGDNADGAGNGSPDETGDGTAGDGQTADTEEAPEPVEFTIHEGELPKEVCIRLEQQGLVESASEFEKFLKGKGYDRSIVAMNYKIPAGADAEKIARIITGHRD